MLEGIIFTLTPIIIDVLELMGIFIISISAIKNFIAYAKNSFRPDNHKVKIRLAQGIALALEFKLAAEILKTVIVRNISEIYILGAVIIIRVILTYVIHWELEKELEKSHEQTT